jgi:hypothetical protein
VAAIIIWDDVALDAYMRDPLDAVGRDLDRRAIQVESAAKINASGRPGPNVITGRLRASITWRPGEDAISQYRDIGSGVFYAPFVELGHPNRAHGFRKRDGTYGYVSNRPTKAYEYLRPALAAALL